MLASTIFLTLFQIRGPEVPCNTGMSPVWGARTLQLWLSHDCCEHSADSQMQLERQCYHFINPASTTGLALDLPYRPTPPILPTWESKPPKQSLPCHTIRQSQLELTIHQTDSLDGGEGCVEER